MISPTIALAAWIPIGLYLFWRYPIRVALLLNFLVGWAILPGAHYVPVPPKFDYWILPLSLPAEYFVTKATVTSFVALAGVLLMDRGAVRRFRLSFWDLPMLFWCAAPLLSGIANGQPPGYCLRAILYQALAWGVPYVAGRIYFSDTDSLRLAAKSFVIAGLTYLPICLVEVFTGPQFYAFVYGYQPYRWAGAHRYLGYRPVGFLEDGTQLGIWMATAALIAVWLWRRRSVERILRIPIGAVAAILCGATLMCQSGASIVLLAILLPFVFMSQRFLPRAMAWLLVVGILAFATFRLANLVSLEKLDQEYVAVHDTAEFLREIKRGSLGWRLEQDEIHVGAALESPIFGSAEWDWWRSRPERPWGLWLLTFGMFGMLGLVGLECTLLLPVARVIWFPLARSDIQAFNLRHTLAAAILMCAVNGLINGSMILPLLLVIGGTSTWASAASAVQVDVRVKASAG